MKFRRKGIGKGHYSVQVQGREGTRFAEIGQVWKEDSKWRTTVNTQSWKSKKIAVALVEGAELLRRMRGEVAPLAVEPTDDEVGVWPSWAKWPEGTILKSLKYGSTGPLEDAFIHRGTLKKRYAIFLKSSRCYLCGTAKQFEEVKHGTD